MSIHSKLIDFHKSFKGAKRTGMNPRFNQAYFTLDDLVQATSKPLADNGLYVRHHIEDDRVFTGIYDVEGECVLTSFPFASDSNPQVMGSSMTYAKKYNIAALLNIGDVDDDGNAAALEADKRAERNKAAEERAAKAKAKLATDEQIIQIKEYMEAGCYTSTRCEWLTKNMARITKTQAIKLIAEGKEKSND